MTVAPTKTQQEDSTPRIIKAVNHLRNKVGSGGFDPRAVKIAEQRLNDAKVLFPKIAASDLEAITYAVQQLQHAPQATQWAERIHWAALELRSNGAMFQYPLVTTVADRLFHFMEQHPTINARALAVITVHLETLHVALAKGPRAITEDDKTELLQGLERAVAKALG